MSSLRVSSDRKGRHTKAGFKGNEPIILGVGTATAIGFVKSVKKNKIHVLLKHPACVDKNIKIPILRNISQRWRLTGYALPI